MKTAALIAGLALGFSSIAPAVAQEEVTGANQLNGWYATLGSGFVAPQTPSANTTVNGTAVTGSLTQNLAYSGELGFGYDFGPIRAEFTYGYTPISSKNWTASWNGGSVSAPLSTNYNLSGFLFGGYYDVKTKSKFTPYIGGAIGPGVVAVPSVSATVNGVSVSTNSTTAGVFAYQAKAGVSYAASKEADLFLEAGYLGASNASVNAVAAGSGNTVSPINIGPNGGFLAKMGFRYRFGK